MISDIIIKVILIMKISLLKKFVIWVAFVTLVVAVIPFFMVFKKGFENPKETFENTVKVYFADTDEVKTMNLEDYIIGVVTAEMPASFNEEALKAQSVASRSYTLSKIKANKNLGDTSDFHKGADICTDFKHCQAYTSKEEAYKNWGSNAPGYYKKISNAVYDTKGEILTYKGEVISAVFHSSNSGKTENSKDIWGGDYPYLASVESFGEENAPKYKTNVKISVNEFKHKLKSEYDDITFDTLIGESTYTSGGSVDEINIGNKKIKGTAMRRIFNLYSANFKIEQLGDNIIFNVTGHGHGVGMSQYGANYMASIGKTYKEILLNYYTDVKISEYKKP